jgi:hypothetical protein
LQGQSLEVFGLVHRKGILHLTLVLPDKSRSYIPASWTDLNKQKSNKHFFTNSQPTSGIIATTRHLLNARKIVDALLCRLNFSEQKVTKASKEENNRAQAIGTVASVPKSFPVTNDLEDAHRSATKRHHSRSGRPHRQNGPLRGHGSGGKP